MIKNIKIIIAALLCVTSLIWLVPTIFVETTISEIKDFELVKSEQNIDTYRITYAYERQGKVLEGHYKAKYSNRFW